MPDERFGRYVWDSDNNQRHLEKHGMSFQSASIALDQGCPINVPPKHHGREERLAHLNGETMKVVTAEQGEHTRIISAHWNSDGKKDFASQYDAKAAEHGVTKNTQLNTDFAAWRRLDERQFQRSKPEADIQREKQDAERQALDQRADLGPEQRAQLQTQQADQHKQQAQQDRQPRLERDAKEREQLAQQQGRQVERQEGRAQQGEQQAQPREARPEPSQVQAEGQQPRRFDPQARRERLTQEAEERGPPTHDNDRKRGR